MIPAEVQWLRELAKNVVRAGHLVEQLYLEHGERGRKIEELEGKLKRALLTNAENKTSDGTDRCKAELIHPTEFKRCHLAAGHTCRHWFGDTSL